MYVKTMNTNVLSAIYTWAARTSTRTIPILHDVTMSQGTKESGEQYPCYGSSSPSTAVKVEQRQIDTDQNKGTVDIDSNWSKIAFRKIPTEEQTCQRDIIAR